MIERRIRIQLRVGVIAFFAAACGVAMGFGGVALESMLVARIGFVITVCSVAVGFVVVFVSMVLNGRSAIPSGIASLSLLKERGLIQVIRDLRDGAAGTKLSEEAQTKETDPEDR